MTTVPVLPETAPFSAEQRAWLNGFFAGIFSRGTTAFPATAIAPPTAALQPLTILFGSQTGSAEGLAKKAAKEAGKRGFVPAVVDMAQMDQAKLAQEKNLLVITSTYGDGEPPDNAKALWSALGADAGPRFPSLRYSVCALGDSNYTLFCQCGKDFDARLEKRGATRLTPRVDCDLDHESAFAGWLDGALTSFGAANDRQAPEPVGPALASPKVEYTRTNPFEALVLTSRTLNEKGSAKAVHHVEFDLAGSGLEYEAGDALGVYPLNCPTLVSEVLGLLDLDGEEAVSLASGTRTNLRQALTASCDLGKASPELLDWAKSSGLEPATTLPPQPHVIDVLRAFAPKAVSAEVFVKQLKKLQPRLYSISSSPKAHKGQVHLTVGTLRYELNGSPRKGACSTFLNERVVPGETRAGVFVHHNKAFRLPENGNTPVIMVGPGTGIAPFRAFLEERAATSASGKNWLFFGDQHAATDFLYREQLTAWVESGVLTHLDTAFSRDQKEKIYVQHRMVEKAAELWSWLEAGAHFYVCGDASRMAKDVDAALHEVIRIAGGKSADEAAAYVQALRTAKRYARDVY